MVKINNQESKTMRGRIVFGLLIAMLIAFPILLFARSRPDHQAPAYSLSPSETGLFGPPSTGASGSAGAVASAGAISSANTGNTGVAASGSAQAQPVAGAGDAGVGDAGSEDGGAPKLMDRSLRVVAMGWDLAAPGILENGGLAPLATGGFGSAGLDVHIGVVDSMGAIEGAMARGGADKDGADIVIVPMPYMISSYEKLRALSPEIFMIVGFSRGREALVGAKESLPSPSAAKDAKDAKDIKIAGEATDPASFLGLFVLDLAGIGASEVKFLEPDAKSDEAPLAAIDRGIVTEPGKSGRRHLLLTTADTPKLMPYVAVAQRGLLEKNGKAISVWAKGWLSGMRKLSGDAPAGARQIAAVNGAPEPLALLKRMGEIAPASLGENVRISGLSGRGALTLDGLFNRTWQLYRGAGILATPVPEETPVTNAVIASLARSMPEMVDPPSAGRSPGASNDKKKTTNDKAKVILSAKVGDAAKLDEEALVNTIGLLAGVFERSELRIAVNQGGGVDGARTKKILERAQDRFDVGVERLVTSKGAIGKGAAGIEVMAAP